METSSPEPVFDRPQKTYRVQGPWRGGPRYVIVAEGRVVASDHKPWLGFDWNALMVRIDRPGLTIRTADPVLNREGRTPVWLSLEEMHVLKKALQHLLEPHQSEVLDEAETILAGETLAELKRIMSDVQTRIIRDTYSEAVARREAWGAEESDAPVD